jgi:hypothetical protein
MICFTHFRACDRVEKEDQWSIVGSLQKIRMDWFDSVWSKEESKGPSIYAVLATEELDEAGDKGEQAADALEGS